MKRGLVYICAGVIFMLPAIIFAQEGLVPCTGPDCGTCELVELGDNILKFFIAISVVLAAVMFAIGGLTMVTSAGDTGKVGKGKTMMTNAIVGFVIVLASWLIIDTALKMVLGGGFGPWNTVQCTGQTAATAVPKPVGGVVATPGAPGTPATGAGAGTTVPFDEFGLTTSQSDASLDANYEKVKAQYASQINQACQGSAIPNCTNVVTALIANESQGNPGAQSGKGASGIMQLLPENGGQTCASGNTSCIQNQITTGVNQLNTLYNSNAVGQNVPNMLAGYNAGQATGEGQSASGLRPALAPSQDCAGLLAYQCNIDPGGLVETQHYVANICQTLTINGSAGCQ